MRPAKTAEVLMKDGTPRLYINGLETPPILFGLSDFPGAASNTAYAQKNIAQFARRGVRLVTADSELRLGWHRLSPFEWEPIQEEIASVLRADADSGILLRLHMNPPYWWLRDNPDEQILYRGVPGIDDGDMPRLIRDDNLSRLRVSLASKKWLREAGECLRLFCENVRDTDEGHAVIGIQVACGLYGEWAHWLKGEDTSQPMRARFHELLRDKYGTDEALRKAWGGAAVTIDTAPFMPYLDQPADDGVFRHPVRSRAVMDAQLTLQTVIAEDILYFNQIIKESWNRPVLTGAFYSYINSYPRPVGGHLLSDRLFARRDLVDYLCGPFPYLANREPENVPMQRGLLESCRLRGVLWLTEMDGHPAGTEHVMGGDPARLDETVAMLRRNTLQPVLAGQGFWYYDHRLIPRFVPKDGKNPFAGSLYRKAGWWDNPVLLDEIGRIQRLAASRARGRYRPAADVLLVYCPLSYYALALDVDEEYALQEAVARAGAAYDCVFLHDLPEADMARYRCVIFTNAYAPDEAQRAMIAERTRGKQVVWLYAAGYSDENSLSVENMARLTGIRVKKTAPQSAYIPEGGGEVPIEPGLFEPMFEVCEGEILAQYAGSGAPMAARKNDVWYFAVPRLDAASARRIFDAAGVHRYVDSGDPVIAGEGLLAVNTAKGMTGPLRLRNGVTREIDLPPMTTAVFDAETGERVM